MKFMFCPKCGTQNPDDGKYCRSCGTDIGNVRAAIDGTPAPHSSEAYPDFKTGFGRRRAVRRLDPNEVYGDAVRRMVTGFGFIVISIVLLSTGVAGGRAWWWAMLFPAFAFIARGFSDFMKSRRMDGSRELADPSAGNTRFQAGQETRVLPNAREAFISPERGFDTGEIVVPPSVTEHTTKRLEINTQGETTTLPKKD
ncbi:MAG TPA: hypothetical protein DEA22_00835 [Blastocatellia bacterium]|nr:hypothetical protein [Blastocatellia bacterium]